MNQSILPIFKRFVNSCCFSIKSLDKSYKIVVFSLLRVLLEFNVCIINSLFFFVFCKNKKCNYLIFLKFHNLPSTYLDNASISSM
jgi:hypothetical protein